MRLGAYELLNEIGRGGLGAVFRARARDGRLVAVKVLLNPESRAGLGRFERERRLLAELGEGFVPILDAGSAPQGPFIVMELVEGGTLRDRLVRQGALKAVETLAVGRLLCAALARAHAQGIVHRDLKPENVLFTKEGKPLVADLGLAKHFDDSSPGAARSVSLSKSGTFRGTPGYMAPEQMKDSKRAGPAADVFALGAILHECLSGESAFAGATPLEVIDRVERGDRRALQTVEAPRFLIEAIERCLEPDERDRYPDAAALLDALSGARKRAAPRGLIAVVVLSALAAIVATSALVAVKLRASKPASQKTAEDDPPPVDLPPPAADLPEVARSFARSKRASLQRVLGSWRWRTLPGPTGSLALTPDGKAALVAAEDRAFLVSLETGETVAVLSSHGAAVTALAISPSGDRAITGTSRRAPTGPVEPETAAPSAIRLWELPSGELLETFAVSPAGVAALAFGTGRFVGATADGALEWYVLDPREHRTADPNNQPVMGLTTSLESSQSIIALADAFIELVPGQAPRVRATKTISCLGATRDGSKCATGHKAGGLRIWHVATGEVFAACHAHEGALTSVAFSPDESKILTTSLDGHAKIWDIAKMSQKVAALDLDLAKPGVHHRWPVTGGAWTPDGKKVVLVGWDDAIHVLDAETGVAINEDDEGHHEIVLALAFARDGKTLLSGGRDDAIRGWDLATGKQLWTEWSDVGEVWAVSSVAGGFVTAGHRIRSWTLPAHKETRSISPPGASYISVSPLADGKFVGACVGGHIVYGELATGKVLAGHDGHPAWARHIPVTKEGFVGGIDGAKIAIRDFESGKPLSMLDASEPIEDMVLSASGERLVAMGGAKVFVWDLPPSLPAVLRSRELSGHVGGLRTVAITKDGKRAASAGRDGTVRLWNLESGREIDRIDLGAANDEAWSLLFAESGRVLYAGTARGVILEYEVR